MEHCWDYNGTASLYPSSMFTACVTAVLYPQIETAIMEWLFPLYRPPIVSQYNLEACPTAAAMGILYREHARATARKIVSVLQLD